jgi:hypothetical protein
MDIDLAVAKVLRDLKFFGYINDDDEGEIREHLHRLAVACWEEGHREIHNNHAIKVVRCDLNGKVLETYNSVVEAAKKMDCKPSGIYFSIYRKSATRAGFRWKYK